MKAVLGINAYHGDSAACLLIDGRLIAAAEEERFRRIKHWAGLPVESIRYCLNHAGLTLSEIDHIAVNRNPRAHAFHKIAFVFSHRLPANALRDRLKNSFRIAELPRALAEAFAGEKPAGKVHFVEHHDAHLASAFFVSPFERAAVVSVDGFGDFASAKWGVGEKGAIRARGLVPFPHSLGLFYLAMTQYLGFPHYGEEYKVMGMAAYGRPKYLNKMRDFVVLKKHGTYALNLNFFNHHKRGIRMSWHDASPAVETVYSERLEKQLGPARRPDEPIAPFHQDIAASAQALYEEAFFHVLRAAHRMADSDALCLAGGCGFNSLANGRIFEKTPFKRLYVQAAAGDAGGAMGAAYHVWNRVLGNPRSFVMNHAYWGPEFNEAEIEAVVNENRARIEAERCQIERVATTSITDRTAQVIADGGVVGWFQGRMEWGPRALGNRSILGDPRRADMKDLLNLKIKRRESFRPFAPSILRERAGEWFETDADVPFMTQVYKIREEKRAAIPAVTHADGTGRLQTVTRAQNERFYALIAAFEKLTGVPMLLNTSFNENEPIVCRPAEALECFLRTKMDVLVIGSFYIERRQPGETRG